jgi:hypothetical protein
MRNAMKPVQHHVDTGEYVMDNHLSEYVRCALAAGEISILPAAEGEAPTAAPLAAAVAALTTLEAGSPVQKKRVTKLATRVGPLLAGALLRPPAAQHHQPAASGKPGSRKTSERDKDSDEDDPESKALRKLSPDKISQC